MKGRAFNKEKDIRKLQIFLAEMRHQVAQAAYFQLGDLLWRMHYLTNGFDETKDIRLWCDENGEIDGFVLYLPSDHNPEFFLRPELYDRRMADEMIAWAVARAQADNVSAIDTSCIDGDVTKAAFLQRKGFQPVDDVMVFMERPLGKALPVGKLPEGYTIVSNVDRPDLPGITGKRNHEEYEYLCQAPGYKSDLGLRVCYRDQEIVSGCVCWYDEVDHCGEFEPVGTTKEHRGKGLAFAVMAQTMAHLKRYEADRVYVRTYKNNTPAVRLYQKLGFKITNEDYGWRLSV